MNINPIAWSAFWLATSLPVLAEPAASIDTTEINIAGYPVPVQAGGLYDRFRSNPPLSVIAQESPDTDLSWFQTLKKSKVEMGFTSYSPNFYYQNERITAVFTADLERLKAQIPAEVLAQVQPVQVWPGRGLVVLTAYAYHYCDNDAYNEIALSIVTNKPGSSNWGPFTLIGQSMSDDYWGYVLKLPVNTELARVRGVVGYNLPKWLTSINYQQDDTSVTYTISDHQTGQPDLVFQADKLTDLSQDGALVKNSFTNINQRGELTYGYAVSRQMQYASTTDEQAVRLTLGNGSLSAFIRSLDIGAMLKYEYVPDFQGALYAPEPLESLLVKKTD